MSEAIQNLVGQISDGKTRSGKFKLDAETETRLDEFVEWLKRDNKSTNTANSYRSYVAKALFLHQDWPELTSDQRSAVRKFAEFLG